MAKRRSRLQRAYNSMQKEKGKYCQGKSTKTKVKKKAKKYKKLARKAGQTKKEAARKARNVLGRGCPMSSHIGSKSRKSGKIR